MDTCDGSSAATPCVYARSCTCGRCVEAVRFALAQRLIDGGQSPEYWGAFAAFVTGSRSSSAVEVRSGLLGICGPCECTAQEQCGTGFVDESGREVGRRKDDGSDGSQKLVSNVDGVREGSAPAFAACASGGSGERPVSGVDQSVGTRVPGFGVRGPNYERNKRKKEARKAARGGSNLGESGEKQSFGVWKSSRVESKRRGLTGRFSGLPEEDQRKLNESYAQRLRAENELKAFKAKQQLELEKAKDLNQLKKRQETHIMRQTEVNKVQVEKAFASLARTGNVPGVVGSVETVVTDGSSNSSPVFSGVGSGTISPNSSVSLAEIRAIQKESLERAAENEKLKRRLERMLELYPDVRGCKFLEPDVPETVNSGVTVDSNGFPIGEFGDGYDGGIREDGKWHFGQDIY